MDTRECFMLRLMGGRGSVGSKGDSGLSLHAKEGVATLQMESIINCEV